MTKTIVSDRYLGRIVIHELENERMSVETNRRFVNDLLNPTESIKLKPHKRTGPAIVHETPGSKQTIWYLNGVKHRIGGPAYEMFDSDFNARREEWWVVGEKHREDGPATKYVDHKGDKYFEWWVKGKQVRKNLTRAMLEGYMKQESISLANLLLDPDSLIRESAERIDWSK